MAQMADNTTNLEEAVDSDLWNAFDDDVEDSSADSTQPVTVVGAHGLDSTHEAPQKCCLDTGPLAAQTHSLCGLLTLPKELLLRVLCFLPASDLTSLSQVCRLFRHPAAEDQLWRRLFCSRWGKPKKQNVEVEACWKRQYMVKDQEDFERTAVGMGTTSDMQSIFLDMMRAKRQQGLGRRDIDDMATVEGDRALAVWRKQRGFGEGSATTSRPDLSGRHCFTFTRLKAEVYCCDQTGWVHVCDDSCAEAVVDCDDDGLLVCPISGRATRRMVCDHEEAQEEGGDTLDYGGLARAYAEGYECHTADELNTLLGIKVL